MTSPYLVNRADATNLTQPQLVPFWSIISHKDISEPVIWCYICAYKNYNNTSQTHINTHLISYDRCITIKYSAIVVRPFCKYGLDANLQIILYISLFILNFHSSCHNLKLWTRVFTGMLKLPNHDCRESHYPWDTHDTQFYGHCWTNFYE